MTLPARDAGPLSRRQFLESTAKNAAGVAAGAVSWAGVAATGEALAGGNSAAPTERLRVGVIGLRGQGQVLLKGLATLPEVELVGLCDVDDGVLTASAKWCPGEQMRLERDFRRLLDDPRLQAVVIATPDHWHAVMATWACRAGKDVYLEAPLSHTLLEGRAILETARQTQRVVFPGLQQRSGGHFRSAIEFVRSGKLGRVHLAKAWTVHQRKSIGLRATGAVPQGVDYDLWQGPAAAQPFQPNRFHYNWHWFWDYGAGELGNWGVHMLDLARWGLGVELPQTVSASGGKFHFDDDQETPDTLFAQFAYPDKNIIWEHRLWTSHPQEGRSTAVAFHGELGTLLVDRGGWKVYGQKDAVAVDASECTVSHLRRFVAAVKSRDTSAAIADLHEGIVSSSLCHLGNLAYRTGEVLRFDPTTWTIPNSTTAMQLADIERRSPWFLA